MALGTKDREEARPLAIVAAATTVRLDAPLDIQRALKAREDWQEMAWGFYDLVGEIKHGANVMGDALSKLRLFVGLRPEDPNDTPEATDEEVPNAELRRLNQGSGIAEIMRSSGIQYSVPGECYLIGIAPRDRDGNLLRDEPFDATEGHTPERWFVLSTEAVKQRNQKVTISDPETGKDVELVEGEDFFARMWRRHERQPWRADSPLRGTLSACEELLIVERAIRSIARSRIGNAGILGIPDELSFGNEDPTTDNANDESEGDPFIEELQEAMLEPVQDEGHASAVVPIVIKGPGDRLEQLRHIELKRTLDPLLAERTDAALKRIAQGMNWPVELMFGLGEANHWGAGQIEESHFRQYVEPLAILAVNNLTEAFLRPSLRNLGVEEPDRFVIWFDPSQLLTDRRKRENASDAHDRLAISDEAYRRALGYTDEDAPEPDERDRRLQEVALLKGRPAPAESSLPADDEPPENGMRTRPLPSLVASNGDRPDDLGQALLTIELALQSRLEGATDAAMRRALERAGNRLRNRARKDPELVESIRGVAPRDVAATLGRTAVAALANADDLLEGAWEDLEDRFERWVAAAEDEALNFVPDLTDVERQEIKAEQAEHRGRGRQWFIGALSGLAVERLFDPAPEPPDQGEVSADTDVPFNVVGEALSRAGGAEEADPTVPIAALGVATGTIMQRVLAGKGVMTEGYEWVYGTAPRETFPPHLRLSGTFFESFDDDALINSGGFPGVGHYHPRDHRGCLCDAKPVMRRVRR